MCQIRLASLQQSIVFCHLFLIPAQFQSSKPKRAMRVSLYSQSIPCRHGIVVKHFHRIQGIVAKVFSYQVQFFQYIVGQCDNMAANGIGVKDIQQFTRPCPDQFSSWQLPQHVYSFRHNRDQLFGPQSPIRSWEPQVPILWSPPLPDSESS